MKSRAEIRQVLIDFDNSTASTLFGVSSAKALGETTTCKDLGPDGSPIAMQIEMEKEVLAAAPKKGARGKGTKKERAAGGGAAAKAKDGAAKKK